MPAGNQGEHEEIPGISNREGKRIVDYNSEKAEGLQDHTTKAEGSYTPVTADP